MRQHAINNKSNEFMAANFKEYDFLTFSTLYSFIFR